MSTNVRALNVLQGSIVLKGNGTSFNSSIRGHEKFAHQLSRTLKRRENPALALIFLAELGSKIDPRNLKQEDQRKWTKLFGEHKQLINLHII